MSHTGQNRSRTPADQPRRPGDALSRLYTRFGHLLREVGKFGVVGAVAYVVDVSVFTAAETALKLAWLPSAVISTAVAATVAFIGNRFWTWRDRPRSGLGREYSLFFVFNVVGLGISLACLWISHDLLGQIWPWFRSVGADLVSKQIVGMALGTLFRFWSYRRFVFPAARPAVDAAGAVAAGVGQEPAGAPDGWAPQDLPADAQANGHRPEGRTVTVDEAAR